MCAIRLICKPTNQSVAGFPEGQAIASQQRSSYAWWELRSALLIRGEQTGRLALCGTVCGGRLLPLRGTRERQHPASWVHFFRRIGWLNPPPHFPKFLVLLS